MPNVFVSYSRRDAQFVTGLAEGLKSRGKDVWVDVEGIRDAEVFPAALRRAIEGSDTFLFVITPDSVGSPFCDQEVRRASELNKHIIPLALRPVPDDQLPEEIRYRNWIPVDGNPSAAVDRIIAAIDADLPWEQEHTRVTVRALEWDEHARDRSFLLRGTELADAERWLAAGVDKDPGPTAIEQEYLLAARQAASRRQRIFVGGSLAVAVVAVGLLISALISRSTAVTAETNARAQALAAESVNQQSVDAERAVLLGAAAVHTKVSYGATGTMFALRSAIDASPVRYRLPDVGVQGCGGPEVAFDPAPQSNLLAEGLCDKTIRFADATTGRIERTVRAGPAAPTALGYTASGSALVMASGARLFTLDPVTGAVRATSPAIPGLGTFAIDPRAPIVAAVGVYQLDLWNMATGRLQVIRPRQARQYGPPTQMAFSPDGRRIAIGFDAGNGGPGLVVYDVPQRRIVRSRRAPSSTVAFSPSGRELAVGLIGATGGSFVMLDASTLKRVPRFRPIQNPDVEPTAAAFSPDGAELAYGFADGTAGLVDATSGQTVQTYSGDTAIVTTVSFRPDGRVVATGSADGTVRVWRAGGLELSAAHFGGHLADLEPEPGGFVTIRSPGPGRGQAMVAQGWQDDGRPAGAPLVLSPTTTDVDAYFLGPKGRLAATIVSSNPNATRGRVLIWNVSQRHLVRTVPVTLATGGQPIMSPSGNLVAMTVQTTGAAQVSGGGPSTSRYAIEVLNLTTGRQRALATESDCAAGWRGYAFNASSTLVAAGTFCGTAIRVWNVATGRPLGRELRLSGELAWIAFRPGGRRLAVASWNGTIEVSPVPVAGRPTQLTENTKGVPMVAYSPDGRYLASAGLDHTVRIFDARSLAELRVIVGPDAVTGVAFTADSSQVMSWGADNTVRRWDACTDCENPPALLALAQTRVTRNLTAQERAEFGVG
jgi:WD40 repeat protein